MTDKTDEIGKGPHRPGEAPRRPYATIDLKATEIGRAERSQPLPSGTGKPEAASGGDLPPPAARIGRATATWLAFASGMAAAGAWALRTVRSNTFLSHMTAGVAGAVLILAMTSVLGLFTVREGNDRIVADANRRLAAVEKSLLQRPALPEEVQAKLVANDARLAKLQEQVQAAQAKLAADAKALDARVPPPGVMERIAKLETDLAALPADGKATGLPDLEKLASEASEAKSASARVERDLATVKDETASVRRGLDALKGYVADLLKDTAKAGDVASILTKLSAMERDVQAVLNTEGKRAAGTQQVLLTLEITNLKRALDRGDSYARELDAVRKTAGENVDLAALDRYSLTGVPPLGALTQEFRRVSNAALDAEGERADASVLDRLMAGARSIVRLRKAHHDADDTSVNATLGRMESALKDGNVGETLAQGKRLPPKAALAAEGWLRRLEARYAADRALADMEAALKASLASQRLSAPEPKR